MANFNKVIKVISLNIKSAVSLQWKRNRDKALIGISQSNALSRLRFPFESIANLLQILYLKLQTLFKKYFVKISHPHVKFYKRVTLNMIFKNI